MPGPVIKQLTVENAGTLKIGKVNIDGNDRPMVAYNVASILTIMIFNGGKLVKQFTGLHLQSKGKL
jgi:thioredoxin 1